MRLKEMIYGIKDLKHYIIASALVFFIGIYIGAVKFDLVDSFIREQLNGLAGIHKMVEGKENLQLWLFFIIFINNSLKAVLFVYAGLFFGLLPLYSLIVNGILLGYIGAAGVQESSWVVIAAGILPHGILEIPAIILASAFGVKFGFLMLRGVFSILLPTRRQRVAGEFRKWFRISGPFLLCITIVLLVAAVIESTVTFWLVGS